MEVKYVIGARKARAQQVGDIFSLLPVDSTAKNYSHYRMNYWHILFGTDEKGTNYMALVQDEYKSGEWHPAYKSGGHWHGSGCDTFLYGYKVYARKNFKDADDANRYYNIVKINFSVRTSQDEKEKQYTEAQMLSLFR